MELEAARGHLRRTSVNLGIEPSFRISAVELSCQKLWFLYSETVFKM